jgi:hypothetical protein
MRRPLHLALLLVALLVTVAGVLVAVDLARPGTPAAAPTRSPSAHSRPDLPDRPDPRPMRIGRPTRVVVPAIGVDEQLTGLGLEPDGAMEMPAFGSAGWYAEGPRPGAPGGAVVVAHVRGPGGPDVFAGLATLRPGDRATVHGTRGEVTFVVRATETVAKKQLPYDRIWPETDEPLLRLITCGGTPGPEGFPANTVVYLKKISKKL